MNKIFFLFTFILPLAAFASNTDLFQYDKNQVETSFAQINEAETYLLSHGELTKDAVTLQEFIQTNNLSENGAMPLSSVDDINWTAFAWGFCCFPVGFFIVVLDGSDDDVLSYLIGLGAIILLGGGGFGFFWWH